MGTARSVVRLVSQRAFPPRPGALARPSCEKASRIFVETQSQRGSNVLANQPDIPELRLVHGGELVHDFASAGDAHGREPQRIAQGGNAAAQRYTLDFPSFPRDDLQRGHVSIQSATVF